MPKGSLYIDAALSNVAVGYKNATFIAPQIFPAVPVMKQSGKVYEFGKDAFRIAKSYRAPGTVSNRVQSFSVSTDSYYCDNHALHDVLSMEERENADAAVQPEVAMTEGLVDMIGLGREKAIADVILSSGTITNGSTLSGTTQWSDYTNSNPRDAALTAIESIRTKSGAKCNVAIMGATVFNKLKLHPDLLDAFKYTTGGVLSEDLVAQALGVDKILVGRAIYNSADEGQTAVMADVWGKHCLFAYIAPTPGLRKPSLGYSYLWKTGAQGFLVEKEDLGPSRGNGTFIQASNYYDDVVHAVDFGYLYTNAIA
jgi:hypothetical protein